MKAIFLLACWLLASSIITAQNKLDIYHDFLQSQFGSSYTDKADFHDSVFHYDFSKIWTVKELNHVPDYLNPIRPEPLGFIGENYQRLCMHFSEITKNAEKKYEVKGKSRVRDNICDFKGYFKILLARQFDTPYYPGEEYTIDPRKITQGVLVGNYKLLEDSTQNHAGIFRGSFVSSFFITPEGTIEYNVTELFSDNYINNQFTGTWQPYHSENERTANWGDYRIPQSGDLDMGAGMFSPSDEYLQYGWQTYRDAYLSGGRNKEAIRLEQTKWWKVR